jgi:glycosyltransferase involved in cell wall biosynthesis
VKLLFIHEVSYRKKVIFEMHEIPELLALRGHDITFLEFDEGGKFWSRNQSPRTEVVSGRVHSHAKVKLLRPFQLGVPGFDRLLAVITVVPLLSMLLKKEGFDAIVLYAVPTYGLQTLWLAKKHKVPVMFRALDVSHKIRSSLLSPVIKAFEKRAYRRADLLSANNPAMASYCNNLGQRTLETKVHFPPLDLSHFRGAVRTKALRAELGFDDSDRVIVYMGSFFYFSGLAQAIIEFGKRAALDSGLRFLLVGGGEQDSELRKLASDLGISEQVVFAGLVSYENLPRYLKAADVAVNTLEQTLVANVALPNKVLQYMAAGLPVVSTKLDGLVSVFGSHPQITWDSDPGAVMARACELAQGFKDELGFQSASASALESFSPKGTVDAFEKDLAVLARAAP